MTMQILTKRRILRALLLIFLTYVLWLGFLWLRFRPQAADAAQNINSSDEIVGVYHIHTRYSDGSRTVEEVARIASQQNLDFIIITDHGNPNPAAHTLGKWQNRMLVLAGTELSVSRGHLVALNYRHTSRPYAQQAELAAGQVQEDGGFTVIAHPYSKVRWSWGENQGYQGLEIISADAMFRNNILSTIPLLPLLAVEPKLPLLRLLRYPEPNLRRWDQLCREQRSYGFFSCDAHLLYGPLFSLLQLHVLVPRPLPQEYTEAAQLVWTALRTGRFYNCVDGAAPGQGFRFYGENSSIPIPMGGEDVYTPSVRLHIKLPDTAASEWRLVRDGIPVLTSTEKTYTFQPESPGVYRVEVFLKERTMLRKHAPWILSNPIFLREKTS